MDDKLGGGQKILAKAGQKILALKGGHLNKIKLCLIFNITQKGLFIEA